MPPCSPSCRSAALALMLWFRDQGWHWAGGLIAALAFCYGASMAWRIQHIGQVLSLAYLPIAMLCLDRALARGSVLYGIAAGVVAAFIVLGRDQVALLAIYLLAAFALWRMLRPSEPRVAHARRALLPLGGGRRCALLLIAVPVLLTALLAEESNRPSIDYIGAARGSLHPALLLTSCMPDVFGAAGRMEDYWGPPSFAWPDTGLFIAQNMGQLYIGAIPLLLLLTAAVRGQLWAREIRFFTVRGGRRAALCARLVHAGVPRALRAAARRQPLPPAGRRDVPGRRRSARSWPATARTGCSAMPAAELGACGRRSCAAATLGARPRCSAIALGLRLDRVPRARRCRLPLASPRLPLRLLALGLGDAAHGAQSAAGRGRARRPDRRRSRLQQRPQLLDRAAARDLRGAASPTPATPPSPS